MEDILIGTENRTVLVFIPDPASTTGAGKAGLLAAAITVTYTRVETDNDVVHADVTSSLTDLSALTDVHTDWGWLEVSATLSKGLYRLDIADAVFASGAWYAVVQVTITSGTAAATPKAFRLVARNDLDGVRLGLTALPNAAADGAGGLPISDAGGLDLDVKLAEAHEVTAARMGALTDWIDGGRLDLLLDLILADTGTDGVKISSGTGSGQLSIAAGVVAADATQIASGTPSSVLRDAIWSTPTMSTLIAMGSSSIGKQFAQFLELDDLEAHPNVLRKGVAQTGGASTITLDASASAVEEYYTGAAIIIKSGAGNLQAARRITAYDGTTKIATVTPAWETAPNGTSTFVLLAAPSTVDVGHWQGTAVTTSGTSAKPEVDMFSISDDSAAADSLETKAPTLNTTTPPTAEAIVAEMDSGSTQLADLITYTEGASPALIADAVLDELLSGHTTAGSLGKAIADILADTGTDGVVIAAATMTAIADALLTRDMSLVTGEASRSLLNTARAIRNKVSISGGTLTVTKENDSTVAWTAAVTTSAAANNITAIDPT